MCGPSLNFMDLLLTRAYSCRIIQSQVKVLGYHDDLQKIRDYCHSRRETEAASLRLDLAIKEKENKPELHDDNNMQTFC